VASETRTEIEARIPHRPPFLFVDRVVERADDSIRTEWTVSPDSDFFRGHYPGQPVLPGVLMTEFCLQSAAILLCEPQADWTRRGAVPVLARLRDARFRRIVRPGETLCASVRIEEQVGPAYHLKADVRTVDGERVMSVRYVLTIAEPEGAEPEGAEPEARGA
jgi:3-hydroxyacyl-[acyl-carrier-protein] dehydratase